MFLRNPERQEDGMGREERDYWEAQLSEYWDSGLTIQEYSELKGIRQLRKAPGLLRLF